MRRVWISRPAKRAGALADALQQAGFAAHLCPAMHIVDLPDEESAAMKEYCRAPARFAASIFVSAEAARRVGECLLPTREKNLPALVVGESTAAALPAAYRLLSPPVAAVSDWRGILRSAALNGAGPFALLGGTDEERIPPSPPLLKELLNRGAEVAPVPCYVRKAAAADSELSALGQSGGIAAAVAYSADSLKYMVAMCAPENAWLFDCPLFVIHDNIADAAKESGFKNVVVAEAAAKKLAQSIASYFESK